MNNLFDLPEIKELKLGNIRYEIGIDRATEKEYGGVKARLIPKDKESEAIEVFIGRNGKLYLPADNIKADVVYEATSYLKFPAVGKSGVLYIDTTTNTAYRFSEADLKYYSVSGITLDEVKKVVQTEVAETIKNSEDVKKEITEVTKEVIKTSEEIKSEITNVVNSTVNESEEFQEIVEETVKEVISTYTIINGNRKINTTS